MKAVRKTFTPFWYTRIKRGRHPIKAKWVINLPGFVVFIGSQSGRADG